jgi:hypothetical protein
LADDELLRRFHNSVIDLILGQGPTEADLQQLAQRCELECPAGGAKNAVYLIVAQARRDSEIRARLLEEIPKVFPKITDQLDGLIKTFPDPTALAGTPAPEVETAETGDGEVFEDAVLRVRSAGALRGKFRDVLFGEEQLGRLHVPDLHEQLLVALNEIASGREILMTGSGRLSVRVRRLLSALARIEDDIEACLGALIHFANVSRSTEDARQATSGAGTTDTDRASAELVRLRELNYCREQVCYRLNRLSEDCDRVRAEQL